METGLTTRGLGKKGGHEWCMYVNRCQTSSGHNGEMLIETCQHCTGDLYVLSGQKLLKSPFQKLIYYLCKTITRPITQHSAGVPDNQLTLPDFSTNFKIIIAVLTKQLYWDIPPDWRMRGWRAAPREKIWGFGLMAS